MSFQIFNNNNKTVFSAYNTLMTSLFIEETFRKREGKMKIALFVLIHIVVSQKKSCFYFLKV